MSLWRTGKVAPGGGNGGREEEIRVEVIHMHPYLSTENRDLSTGMGSRAGLAPLFPQMWGSNREAVPRMELGAVEKV